MENDKKPAETIRREGAKKQCKTHMVDKVIATWSDFSCWFIIIIKVPQTQYMNLGKFS
jgi:hypothetical protein